MKYLIVLMFCLVAACAGPKGSSGASGPQGVPGVVIAPPVVAPSPVDVLVAEYNEQRIAVGQELIEPGLQCTLYTVPNTTTAIVGATLTTVGSWAYSGDFDFANGPSSPGIGMLPPTLLSLYTSYYVIKCTGLLINPVSGFYGFELSSDDGANLSINGAFINNDGVHGIVTKSGAKYMARGVYSFELDYSDAGGSHALMLYSGSAAVPAVNFYH
jgi:hypothetical protein